MSRFRVGNAVLLLGLLLVAACRQDSPAGISGRVTSEQSAVRDDSQARIGPSSIEDEFLALSEETPGFAGLYLDAGGTPVIRVRGAQPDGAAMARIVGRISLRSGLFSSVAPTRVETAKFSFRELDATRERVRALIRATRLLMGVGIDVEMNAVVLTVGSADASVAKRAIDALRLPEGAIELRVLDGITGGVSLRDVVRPVTGGLMISSGYDATGYCSAGLQVWKNDVNGYPDPTLGRFILTANHCAPPIGTVTGLTFGQPHRGYGLHATEVTNAEVFTDARCPYAPIPCAYADVAVLQMSDSVSSTWQRVALSNTSNPPAYLGQLSLNTSIWSAVQGQPVRRVGARSGQRDGTVTRECYDLPVGGIYILCSVEVNGYANGGDSGGPVYTPLTAGYTGSPWPSGIFHSYLTGSNNPYWFSSVGSILYALGGAYTI